MAVNASEWISVRVQQGILAKLAKLQVYAQILVYTNQTPHEPLHEFFTDHVS